MGMPCGRIDGTVFLEYRAWHLSCPHVHLVHFPKIASLSVFSICSLGRFVSFLPSLCLVCPSLL